MTHITPEPPIDPAVVERESLTNTDVDGQIDEDPEAQANRESAPDPATLPDPDESE